MLRHLFVLSLVATAAPVAFAAAGDPCAAGDPSTCTAATLEVCNTQANPSVFADIDCSTVVTDGTCGDLGCVGTCPAADLPSCLASSACQGLGAFNDDNTNNDFLVSCSGDSTCKTQPNTAGDALEDVCVPHAGPACAAGDTGAGTCTGTLFTACIPLDQAGASVLTSNIALDCTADIGATGCGQQPCSCDAQCGTTGHCTGGFCDTGTFCTFEPDATKCTGGGEGEGEGEGEGDGATCQQDSECDSGQVCNRGKCEADTTETPPGCSSNGTGTAAPLAGLLALVAVIPMARRRRA